MAVGIPADWEGPVGTEEDVTVAVDATLSPSSMRRRIQIKLTPPSGQTLSAHDVAMAMANAWNDEHRTSPVIALPPTPASEGGTRPNRLIFTILRPGSQINDVLVEFQGGTLDSLVENQAHGSTVNSNLTVTRRAQMEL